MRHGIWAGHFSYGLDAVLDPAEKAAYRAIKVLDEDPSYRPPFGVAIHAALEALKLQQIIAQEVLDRGQRAQAGRTTIGRTRGTSAPYRTHVSGDHGES